MSVIAPNNVTFSGNSGGRPMLFAHGFGCDQRMWRHVAPAFAQEYRTVLFDHVGAGRSEVAAYDYGRYDSLDGYAEDVVEVCTALGLRDVVFVGHSVSAMIGALAEIHAPGTIGVHLMVGPSPRYLDDVGYVGGFSRPDIEGLLQALDGNYLGWARMLAPLVMGHPDRPELAQELEDSFCRTDPKIARQFAEVTFLSDNRADLVKISAPTLVIQSAQDDIAPLPVGEYLHRHIAGSELAVIPTSGHCPHMGAPDETVAAIRAFLDR